MSNEARATDSDRKLYQQLKDAEKRKERILGYAILFMFLASIAVTQYLGSEAGAVSFLSSLASYLFGYRYAAAIGDMNVATFALMNSPEK